MATTTRATRGRPPGQSRGTRALTLIEDASIALYLADDALERARIEIRTVRAEFARHQLSRLDAA